MSDEPDMVCLYDSRIGFWGRHFVSYSTLLGMIGIGRWIESDALQWVAAVIWFIGIMGFAISYSKQQAKTPQAAADYLLKAYAVTGRK